MKNEKILKNIFITVLIIVISGIIGFYQTKKVGLHEDEGYTMASSVNPTNGLMVATDYKGNPQWLSKNYVTDYVTLSVDNFLNLKSVYINQAYDNHPPFFYAMVHFSSILFGGNFTTYTVFVVNIIAFILSCIVIRKIFIVLDKDNLSFAGILLYGLSMGTISMVLFQRMYMLLTFFILLYFYLTLKIVKNDFTFDKKNIISLGATTILGFLTQYFFAIYAFFIFVLMLIQMIRKKVSAKTICTYIISHVMYGVIGVLLFIPCIAHLLFSDRGLTNLGNSEYFSHLWTYIKHLSYSFTINNNISIVMIISLIIFFGLVIYLFIKNDDKFVVALSIIPSILYFFIAVKMTSFQELRYIMPVIPFVVLEFILILDTALNFKYKNIVITIISLLIVINGFIFSKPLFLYEDYSKCLDIANKNSDKSFVYVYDNFFNHMQSIPEMMIYNKTLIINVNSDKDELNYAIKNEELNSETSFILSIKNYMDNDKIIEEFKTNTGFKNIEKIYEAPTSHYEVGNNLYLVSK